APRPFPTRRSSDLGETRTDDKPETLDHRRTFDLQLLHKGPRPHDSGHAVAIGDADAAHAERYRFGDHFGRVRGAAKETVVGGSDQFGKSGRGGEAAHANSPWIYQRGSGFSS